MSFDPVSLREVIARHGLVIRVLVAEARGSTPRETGTSMLVWNSGQLGTIGGGTLEFQASERARGLLDEKQDLVERLPLGPSLGQCCGGSVTLLFECWDENRLAKLDENLLARPLPGQLNEMPLAVRRLIGQNRAQGSPITPAIVEGWMVEPISHASRQLWVYGAGHVGRAIVSVLSPLPEFEITWVDTGDERFPTDIPANVTKLVAANPAEVVRYAPPDAEHLILTYSHQLDLDLCHALLDHGFKSAGLIGSATKWARFRRRLSQLNHGSAQIDRIACPIGDPRLGKHPQAIAVGVANTLLYKTDTKSAKKDATG